MAEYKAGMCRDAWLGFIGAPRCNTNGNSPMCFLNCCNFAVPWLELFGYGSLLWNIMWLIDLVRYTMQPLAPEKALGVPIVVFYHLISWTVAVLIAFGMDFSRLDVE